MKIAFLLGSPEISGGTYVIYEHAIRLQRMGHQLSIITEHAVTPQQYSWHTSAGELRWLDYEQAEQEQFDIVLATWWQSPFLLKNFSATHYVYFVQSIETRFFEPPDPEDYGTQDHAIWKKLCEKTYSFALPMITEACWIQEYLHQNYNTHAHLVRNGIRKDIYTESGATVSAPVEGMLRVLVEGPVDVAYKNVPAAIKLAKQAGVDEIWLLTSSDIAEYPGVDRVFSRVPIHGTPTIYRSCDVLLKLSYVEGMFGPPLEMFHCGGTAIVYKVTGYDEYIVHDQNSLVADRDDEQEVVRYLLRLKEQPDDLARLKAGALDTAILWPDWDHCADKFAEALQDIVSQQGTSRRYLERYTKEIMEMAIPLKKESVLKQFATREKKLAHGEETDKHNFVELYWHCQDHFKPENLQWCHYSCEGWSDISFKVDVTGFPFWLRIDPSTRIGIVEIDYIIVTNMVTGSEIMAFRDSDDFAVLLLSGTAYWIDLERKNIIFSFGEDPAMVLPAVTGKNAAKGDTLRVEISLRETGIQQFCKQYKEMSCPPPSHASPEAVGSTPLLQRVINKFFEPDSSSK